MELIRVRTLSVADCRSSRRKMAARQSGARPVQSGSMEKLSDSNATENIRCWWRSRNKSMTLW